MWKSVPHWTNLNTTGSIERAGRYPSGPTAEGGVPPSLKNVNNVAGNGEKINMNYFVYILLSVKDGKYYIGSTKNVEKRLREHNSGSVLSTKSRRPFQIVYTEEYPNKRDAHRREQKIKSYKGGRAFKSLLTRVDTQAVNGGRL